MDVLGKLFEGILASLNFTNPYINFIELSHLNKIISIELQI